MMTNWLSKRASPKITKIFGILTQFNICHILKWKFRFICKKINPNYLTKLIVYAWKHSTKLS